MTPDSLFFSLEQCTCLPSPQLLLSHSKWKHVLHSQKHCSAEHTVLLPTAPLQNWLFLHPQSIVSQHANTWGTGFADSSKQQIMRHTQTLLHFCKVCRQARLNLAGYFCVLHYATVCSRLNYCMLSTLWTVLSCYVMDCFCWYCMYLALTLHCCILLLTPGESQKLWGALRDSAR